MPGGLACKARWRRSRPSSDNISAQEVECYWSFQFLSSIFDCKQKVPTSRIPVSTLYFMWSCIYYIPVLTPVIDNSLAHFCFIYINREVSQAYIQKPWH